MVLFATRGEIINNTVRAIKSVQGVGVGEKMYIQRVGYGNTFASNGGGPENACLPPEDNLWNSPYHKS